MSGIIVEVKKASCVQCKGVGYEMRMFGYNKNKKKVVCYACKGMRYVYAKAN